MSLPESYTTWGFVEEHAFQAFVRVVTSLFDFWAFSRGCFAMQSISFPTISDPLTRLQP